MFWPGPGKDVQTKKVPLSQINISLFSKFWLFWERSAFLAKKKKHILAERKNGRFSVIPAGTKVVVSVGHFLMAQTVPSSYVDHGPKLRVLTGCVFNWPP